MIQNVVKQMNQQAPTHNIFCQVCNGVRGTPHTAKEMMLGTKEEFIYWECLGCGCLALVDIPDDLGRYYPKGYYSFIPGPSKKLKKLKDSIYLSPFSFCVNWRRRTDLDVIRRVNLQKDMSLLDVGCGAGHLISSLRNLGYNARGIDPHIDHDVRDHLGTKVEKKTLPEIEEKFDVILFRHSLEHMSLDMLRIASERLKEFGTCVVCIPLVGWAWGHYACHWAQLDAPRHLFLHTRESFTILARNSGFTVADVVYDSNEFQFWASKSYLDGIPLSKATKPSYFQRFQLRRRAAALNALGEGDTAQFYLKLKT